jgi:hypothetical protein
MRVRRWWVRAGALQLRLRGVALQPRDAAVPLGAARGRGEPPPHRRKPSHDAIESPCLGSCACTATQCTGSGWPVLIAREAAATGAHHPHQGGATARRHRGVAVAGRLAAAGGGWGAPARAHLGQPRLRARQPRAAARGRRGARPTAQPTAPPRVLGRLCHLVLCQLRDTRGAAGSWAGRWRWGVNTQVLRGLLRWQPASRFALSNLAMLLLNGAGAPAPPAEPKEGGGGGGSGDVGEAEVRAATVLD